MTTHYTSDHHFHHRGIINLVRDEFPDLEAMHEHLIERWNSVVKPDDDVFHLGDFAFKPAHVQGIVARLNGNIHLIGGNHDPFWTGHHRETKARNALERYRGMGFASITASGQKPHQIDGRPVLLSHLPYYGDSQRDERYSHQRPKDDGTPILCGHVHDTWEKMYGNGKVHRGQIHVGVDAWDYLPVEEGQVIDLLRATHPAITGGTR